MISWRQPRSLPKIALPVVGLLGLAALDLWTHQDLALGGVVLGMALMAGLVAVLQALRRTARQQALLTAVRAVLELVIGVLLVFLLAAPLAAWLPEPWVLRLLGSERATDFVVLLLLGLAMWVLARAWLRVQAHATERARAERDAAQARERLAEQERALLAAELQTLRAQVEPHFLWNTLANVEYLMRKDTAGAQAMMRHLIAYLRASLPAARAQGSSLEAEFRSIEAYLQLMRWRMGERFGFELQLPPDCGDQPFPPLLLQTLVENAIKHGLEPMPGPALLKLSAGRSGTGRLFVEVLDNGLGLRPSPATRGTGLGLRNVRERLHAVHGEAAQLSVSGAPKGGVCARIEWPAASERR